jgi:cell division protein FtsB
MRFRLTGRQNLAWIVLGMYLGGLAVSSVIGDRGLWASYRLWHERQRMEREITVLRSDVERLQEEIVLFRSDKRTIERYARQELQLVGKDEIQYIFEP